VKQYCWAGLNFGYYYDASPLIAYDVKPAPAYSMDRLTPSIVPAADFRMSGWTTDDLRTTHWGRATRLFERTAGLMSSRSKPLKQTAGFH
jgi:hypothetical protein